MYCRQCGNELPDGAEFCVKCGAQVAGPADSPKRGSGGRRAAIVVAVVAACALLVSLLLVVPNMRGADGPGFAPSPNSDATDDPRVLDDASASDDAEIAIDLAHPDDYARLNVFLSNFAEVWAYAEFDASSANSEDLARFAVYHCGRNSSSDWEYAPTSPGYYDIPGTAGGWNGHYNVRVSSARVSEIVRRYFGYDIDYSEITGSYRGPYHYEDGYVYFGVTGGVGIPSGVALADSVEYLDGAYRVAFSVYGGPDSYYDATDQAYYSLAPQELMARMGVNGPWLTGNAVVMFGEYDEYTGGLVLREYYAQRVNQSSQSAQAAEVVQPQGGGVSSPASKSLSGVYAMAANHTVEFDADGTCIMQDNGVSWPGTYRYDESSATYKVVINSIGGSVETYAFTSSGENLVLHQNGYDFEYEKQ